jgi:hypothetical protein
MNIIEAMIVVDTNLLMKDRINALIIFKHFIFFLMPFLQKRKIEARTAKINIL